MEVVNLLWMRVVGGWLDAGVDGQLVGGSIGPSRSQPMAPAAAIRQCNRHHFSARKELRRDLPIGGSAVRCCVGELYAYWPGVLGAADLVRTRGRLGTEGELHETAHGFFILAVKFYSQLGGVFGARIGFCGVKHGGERYWEILRGNGLLFISSSC